MKTDSQIYFWAHMLDECFNKDQFLCEDKEGKNINRAEKWIKDNRPELIGKEINGRIMLRARDVVTQVRHDIPSARLPYDKDANGQRIKIKLSNGDIIDKGTCKYLPGICRIYLNDLPNKTQNQAQLVKLTSRLSDLVNVVATQFDGDFREDDNGRDFNGLSFDELENKYGRYVEELKRKEREEAKKSLGGLKKNEDYDIVKIESFDDAERFRPYVSWCVTLDESLFDDYTTNGEKTFYFAVRKDFKDVAKDDPSYATSMLAILTYPDGSMDSSNGCTSRLNNGGKFMDPKQVQDLLGVDFYKTFSDEKKAIELQYLKDHVNEENEEVEKILSQVDEIREDTIPKNIRKYITSVDIPRNVVRIGENAFYNCTSLTSVTIPDSVTNIGIEAFYDCRSLTHVTIPNSVMSIGSFAFDGCSNLTSITISDSVTSIGSNTFSGCRGLMSVTIPDSVISIGSQVFHDCRSLTHVTIPNSVMNIGDSAFSQCSDLKSVTIPDSVTSIGYEAFKYCEGLTRIIFKGKTLREVKAMKNYPFGIKDESIIHCEK